MRLRLHARTRRLTSRTLAAAWLCPLTMAALACTQAASGQSALHSQGVAATVVDPSGAKIVHAEVIVFLADSVDGAPVTKAETDTGGVARLSLPRGTYVLQISAAGFTKQRQSVTVTGDSAQQLTLRMRIATAEEFVSVPGDEGGEDGAAGGEALTLRADRLRTLSDDPAIMQQQLNALVGSDDGTPPQLRIDGFTGGRMPPKSAIREIRINQNAYSAQFDQRGNSVIDIFTKPGTDKWHGQVFANANTDALNARNPFIASRQPGYYTFYTDANASGPLSGKTSLFVDYSRRDQQNNAAVNASVLDASYNVVPFSAAVPAPTVTNGYNARIDRQFGPHNTLTGRFDFTETHQTNVGVGQLVLASQGYTADTKLTTLQLGNTTIASPHVVVESRFQYRRTRTSQTPVTTLPSLVVQGSFNGGGSNGQSYHDAQDNYEWQEYLSFDHGKHFLRAGGRYRLTRDSNSSTAGYNGQYIFPSITAYQITQRGLTTGQTQAQIRAAGGGASQYYITVGTPSAVISTGDLGVYIEDEWRVRPGLSLTAGLRYESQYGIPDNNDPAPRLGFSWQISRKSGKVPVARLRGGIGMFYDRFDAGNILIAARQNGVLQRSYFVQNPDFYPGAQTIGYAPVASASIYQIAPDLRAAYVLSEGIGADRRLFRNGTFSLSYTHEHGAHQYLLRNANAPIGGSRPAGGTQNVYQYASAGKSDTHTLFANYNLQFGNKAFLWSNYTLRFRDSSSGGAASFVSNSYNPQADYGRTAYLARHRFTVGAYTELPYRWSTTLFLTGHSALRYNITIGQDNNGDSIFNDRPAFATDLTRPSVVRTAEGDFDTAPVAGQTVIPINYGVAPAFYSLQAQLGRTFSFGPELPKRPGTAQAFGRSDRLFTLFLGVQAENAFNHVNAAMPIGQLTSPSFGRSLTLNNEQTNSTAANRIVNLMLNLYF